MEEKKAPPYEIGFLFVVIGVVMEISTLLIFLINNNLAQIVFLLGFAISIVGVIIMTIFRLNRSFKEKQNA